MDASGRGGMHGDRGLPNVFVLCSFCPFTLRLPSACHLIPPRLSKGVLADSVLSFFSTHILSQELSLFSVAFS